MSLTTKVKPKYIRK